MEYYLSLHTIIPSYRPARKDAADFLMMEAQPAVENLCFKKKKKKDGKMKRRDHIF